MHIMCRYSSSRNCPQNLGIGLTDQEWTIHGGSIAWMSELLCLVGRISRIPVSYISLSDLNLYGECTSCQIQGESVVCVGYADCCGIKTKDWLRRGDTRRELKNRGIDRHVCLVCISNSNPHFAEAFARTCVFICNWIKKRRQPRANNVTLKLWRVREGDKPL